MERPVTRALLARALRPEAAGCESASAAAGQEPAEDEAFPLLDLPGPCLWAVLCGLWREPADVAAVACASRATAALCDDLLLWRHLLQARYGPDALPGVPEPCQPLELEGWVFFQGLDASSAADAHSTVDTAARKTLDALAQACTAAGCEAFTTSGVLINTLGSPQQRWRRVSYRPDEGTYVRQEVVTYRELTPPAAAAAAAGGDTAAAGECAGAPASAAAARGTGSSGSSSSSSLRRSGEASKGGSAAESGAAAVAAAAAAAGAPAWPPAAPGWVYFPSVTCPGYFQQEPPFNLAHHASLAALLAVAARDPRVVAVTPAGETKLKLRPQACWRVHPRYDVGLYVKESVVQQLALSPPQPVPDYRALAARLARLRLPAGAMDACWCDDHHLSLTAFGEALPAGPRPRGSDGTVLALNTVCWLEIAGSIPGVPPGEYQVLWCVDLSRAVWGAQDTLHLRAVAAPAQPALAPPDQQRAHAQAQAQAPGAQQQRQQQSGEAAADIPGSTITHIRDSLRRGERWVMLSGGVLHVPAFSTVSLRCWNHNSEWKGHVLWSHAELQPVNSTARAANARRQHASAPQQPAQQQGWLRRTAAAVGDMLWGGGSQAGV